MAEGIYKIVAWTPAVKGDWTTLREFAHRMARNAEICAYYDKGGMPETNEPHWRAPGGERIAFAPEIGPGALKGKCKEALAADLATLADAMREYASK